MKNAWPWVLGAAAALLGVGALLWLAHPLAPWLLVLTLAVQVPLVAAIGRRRMAQSYRQRTAARRIAFLQGGSAAAWLAQEEKEAAAAGYRVWSRGSRALCCLARCEALLALARRDEAATMLAEAEACGVAPQDRPRYEELLASFSSSIPFHL